MGMHVDDATAPDGDDHAAGRDQEARRHDAGRRE